MPRKPTRKETIQAALARYTKELLNPANYYDTF